MKKILFILVAVSLTFVYVMNVKAVDVDFSGEYYVESMYNSNENLSEDDSSNQYSQMRLRVQTDFTVTENLSLTTRFDALDKVWDQEDSVNTAISADRDNNDDDDAANIDFDRAYMTIKSKIGLFRIGRQQGVVWGTSWADSEQNTDRILYLLPLDVADGKFYTVAVWEKVSENDGFDATDSDNDNDKYYLSGTFKNDTMKTGLLLGYYGYRRVLDPGQNYALGAFSDAGYGGSAGIGEYSALLTAYGTALVQDGGRPGANVAAFLTANPGFATANAALGAPVSSGGNADDPMHILATRGATTSANIYLISPYFDGKFLDGKLDIKAELQYVWGTTEYEGTEEDHDAAAYGYFLEGTYHQGPLSFQLGWAHRSGDSDITDTDEEPFGYFEPGEDWEKMYILSTSTHGMSTTLGGGIGTHVGDGDLTYYRALLDGFQMPYIGVDYALREDITIGVVAAMSTADATVDGWDDDQGIEADLKFSWDLMDNLEYEAVAAYLAAGDYWKGDEAAPLNADPEDIYCFYNKLTLTF